MKRGLNNPVGRSWLDAIAIFALMCCVMLISGCERNQLNALTRADTILAFGDSLTEGYGVSEADSYPRVLAQLTGMRVVNEGISGELSADGLERLPAVLARHKPALMVLMHGGNDILQNRPLSDTKYNLAAMIELAKNAGAQVILIGVPEKNLFSNSAPIYGELAKRYNLVFDDDLIADLIRSPSKKSDSVHFNVAGYADVAQAVKALMDDAGAI